eukprot:1720224-Amphidinium_carterae.3
MCVCQLFTIPGLEVWQNSSKCDMDKLMMCLHCQEQQDFMDDVDIDKSMALSVIRFPIRGFGNWGSAEHSPNHAGKMGHEA